MEQQSKESMRELVHKAWFWSLQLRCVNGWARRVRHGLVQRAQADARNCLEEARATKKLLQEQDALIERMVQQENEMRIHLVKEQDVLLERMMQRENEMRVQAEAELQLKRETWEKQKEAELQLKRETWESQKEAELHTIAPNPNLNLIPNLILNLNANSSTSPYLHNDRKLSYNERTMCVYKRKLSYNLNEKLG